MQAAQWGWLHSTPDGQKKPRIAMYGGRRAGIETDLDGEYLLDVLFTVGPTEFRGSDECPITWAELLAYGSVTGAISEPWEYEAVMAMSRAYFSAKNEGRNVFCIPPVEREE